MNSCGGLSKKEYLKKYLGGGEKKKKRKKSTQSLIIKSKIVDDDIDLKSIKPIDEDELDIYDLAEEAPQIVGIIDERPEEVRLMSEFRSTKKWKIVADGIEDVKITSVDHRKTEEGSSRVEKEISIQITKNIDKRKTDSDESPPRSKKTIADDVHSEILKNIKKEIDSDSSPPRQNKRDSDTDSSPPRKSTNREKDESRSKTRDKGSDASPPVRTIKKEKEDSDTSPPRKRKDRSDSDPSPPRKSTSGRKKDSSRHHHHHSSRRSEERNSRRSRSPEKSRRKKNDEYGLKVVSSNESDSKKEKKSSQIEKTLSGKKAGLQSAEEMKKEGEKLRQKEKEMFEKMSDDMTGRHATAIVRNRKTGRRHDAKEEARKKREKEEKEAEKIAQYAVWGKGVKQVQDRQDKIKDDLYEMSKPLARYKDDKDLEEMRANEEREGDPMLEYIRRKKKSQSSKPSKPEYEGVYLPNRYDIKPGHRWDGVDRSNGYEKKWFEEQSAKKAREEEAFKWSTYDM